MGRLHRRGASVDDAAHEGGGGCRTAAQAGAGAVGALAPAHRRLYDKQLAAERKKVLGLVDDLRHNRITILASLTLLRQLALSPALVLDGQPAMSAKLDALVELAHRTRRRGPPGAGLQPVHELSRHGARPVGRGGHRRRLPGRTHPRPRPRRAFRFKDGDAPVFLISLKAGGFGLNLTEADYVLHPRPVVEPRRRTQAVDRTHRIGQERNPVMVYRMVVEDTIEEKVMELKARKRTCSPASWRRRALAAALTEDDIRGLLEP